MNPSDWSARIATYQIVQEEMRESPNMWIQPRRIQDHPESFVHNEIEYSIINARWAHPRSSVILRNCLENATLCLIIDTTWTALREYATAIAGAISKIPQFHSQYFWPSKRL
jgi:hypothetical protein